MVAFIAANTTTARSIRSIARRVPGEDKARGIVRQALGRGGGVSLWDGGTMAFTSASYEDSSGTVPAPPHKNADAGGIKRKLRLTGISCFRA